MIVFGFGGGAGGIETIRVACSAMDKNMMVAHPLVP
jgi:hypothetical protein